MINQILVGIIVIIGIYIIYIAIKGGVQLSIEWDELEMVHTYNFLVIYKKYLTGQEDITLTCEITDDVGYLFSPFNFETLLTRAAKGYIMRYFKDNYYILDMAKEKWPAETAGIERMRKVMDKWI